MSQGWPDEERFGTAKPEAIEETPELEALESLAAGSVEASGENTRVNQSRAFDAIKDEYIALFRDAIVNPDRLGSATQRNTVRWFAAKIVEGRERYDRLERKSRVPWYIIGIIHALECSFDFKAHLFNGDPLSDFTKRYPPGHPKNQGSPPFTFEASAAAALEHDGLSDLGSWDLPHTLNRLERYNGMSYRAKLAMASPYLWSFSNHYVRGKFKEVPDGHGGFKSIYDPNLVSKQCGAAVMLKELHNSGTIAFA